MEESVFYRERHVVQNGIFLISLFSLSLQSINNVLENSDFSMSVGLEEKL